MKRKSWFRRSLAEPLPPTDKTEIDNKTDHQDAVERLRPLQFSPNRIATLYVTPSERNLYLAAMSQLDNGPPPLPLWSEPAPILPPLPPRSASGHFPSLPFYQRSPTTSPPPKLVTSPNLPNSRTGPMVRDEFRRIESRNSAHAFLSLNPPSELLFTGFPVKALLKLDAVVGKSWPMGVARRSESMDALRAKSGSEDGLSWKMELVGKVWQRKGHQELEYLIYPIKLHKY